MSASSAAAPAPPLANGTSSTGQQSDFFPEDVIEIASEGNKTAIVTRCWEDEQSEELVDQASQAGIPFSPLRRGEIEVTYPDGSFKVINEREATIKGRHFVLGDVVKPARASKADQAGIVKDLRSRVRLQRALTGETLDGWHDVRDLVSSTRLTRGDHVCAEGWIGVVEDVCELALVQSMTSMGRDYTVWPNQPPARAVRVADIRPMPIGTRPDALHVVPLLNGQIAPPHVVEMVRLMEFGPAFDSRQTAVAVNWLCMNQLNPPQSQTRPQRFFADLSKLSLVRALSDSMHSVGDKVEFRDRNRFPPPPELLARTDVPFAHHAFVVTDLRNEIEVVWQDGTTTTGESEKYAPCLSVDEDADTFPGDVGMYDEKTPAVVQSMDSRKRTLRIRRLDDASGEVEVVSALEFDAIGPPPDMYGVRRGDRVVLAPDTKGGNGMPLLKVPKLGESEVLLGIFPTPEELRHGLIACSVQFESQSPRTPPSLPRYQPDDVDWYGVVVDLALDGKATVEFPNGKRASVPHQRLYILDDGLEDEHTHEDGEGSAHGSDDDQFMDVDSNPDTDKSWTTEDDEDPHATGWADEEEEKKDQSGEQESSGEDVAVAKPDGPVSAGPALAPEVEAKSVPAPPEVEDVASWQRFAILEEVPSDHHYINEPQQQPTKAFMARMKKEYNVLASSLPPNILVRAYEGRADLMRCLIVGPLGTPFQNAPFLFDLYLPPSRFPQDPPKAYFHSWASSARTSPNLYTEGKICLSLLGTWSGDKMENWSGSRSSILQIFVSIQALVMVEEPYYTEPGFEKQKASGEGHVASLIYNERSYVLTRAFVRHACQYPPQGFADEIRAYYFDGLPGTPGVLQGIIDQAKALLQESEAHQRAATATEDDEFAISKVIPGQKMLSEGACLSLRRTVAGLESLRSGET